MSDVLVDDLKRCIADGQAIAIIGAGVSMGATGNAPAASWMRLLEDGIGRCEALGRDSAGWGERQRAALGGDLHDLLGVAEQVALRLGYPDEREWARWLRDTVGSLELRDGSVLSALRDLCIRIATTNYDGLIEAALGRPQHVTWREPQKVLEVLRDERDAAIHLHGHWDDPASVILGIRSYEHVLGAEFAQALQDGMSLFGTVVFIGCGEGLNDPNFSALRAFMTRNPGRHRHFRLELDHRCADLRKEHAADGISVIGYGETHGHLAPFLRELATRTPGAGTSTRQAPALPPPPARCFGREREVETLALALLAGEPVAVLGPAGIGKSTVCLEALHDPGVEGRFGRRRHFVRLDGAATAKDMVAGIAAVLGLPVEQARIGAVVARLAASPAALALDNLETPWAAETLETEAVLAELAAVPGASLAVTLRRGQQPGGVAWREPVEVRPLGTEDARRVFLATAGNRHVADPRLGDLLSALDGVPLAIELLAYPAQAEPDLDGLWQRWQSERTAMLRRGRGDHRLLDLGVSLELSIRGPGMTDPARRLLSLLGRLPDGIARPALETLLPGCGNAAAATLRQVALAFDEARRVRVLAPIREHLALRHPPAAEDLTRAIDHYAGLARDLGPKAGQEGGAEAIAALAGETANIEHMLLAGLRSPEPRSAVEAAIAFAEFQRWSGLGTVQPLDAAIEASRSIDDALAADASFRRGLLASQRSDHDCARERYEAALPLYRRVGDVLGEANCIKSLGNIALERSDHDGARERYEAALPLYRRVGDVLGEANCIKSLGDIALARSEHDGARERYEAALPLHRRVGDVLGEASCIQRLGDIALARSEHDGARERYEAALPLYCRVGSVLGEANCIQGLGDIAHERSDHDGARRLFEEALGLYLRIQEPYSIGAAHCRLARIARDDEERGRHMAAAREAWRSIGRDDLVQKWLDHEDGEA